jgi:prepilin-type N-terminal cleavage/methylation domain-containing protein
MQPVTLLSFLRQEKLMYNNHMKNGFFKQSQKGFTLMEVMVAVSIFTIVVTIGIGSLLTINAIDSLTYILESMSRSIRTAELWHTPAGAPSTSFRFLDQDGVEVSYQYDTTNPGHIAETIAGTTNDITPDGVDINPADFPGSGLLFTPYLDGHTGQKYVQINLGGQVQNAKITSQFMFQTGISKRSFE